MPVRYRRLVVRVEADAELLTALLWEHGTLGLELVDERTVVAYFEEDAPAVDVDWDACGARIEADDICKEQDWMSAYRAASRPLPIGERLVVDPREPEHSAGEDANWPGRRHLRLPARTAFGTGSHASTRLVIEVMEDLDLHGLRVLDVGVGSGILSFVALALGARHVVGVEIDPAALLVAEQNRRLNGLFPSWAAGTVRALAGRASFDLALVNVLPEHVADDLQAIRELLRPDGAAIYSGVLVEAEPAVVAALERAGFDVRQRRSSDGWSALLAVAEQA